MHDPQFLQRLALAVPPSALDVRAVEYAPESLHTFTRIAWPLVEPGRPFIDGKVVHVLCETLEAITAGEIKRAVINVPPGFMKSLLTGVFWPTWEWLSQPHNRWIYASYDPGLTLRDAKKSFELIDSQWFKDRWGEILLPGRQPFGDYFTKERGNRFSTSIKGKATGRHFERQVLDDPLKPKDALGGVSHSEAALQEAWSFWEDTMPTRTANVLTCVRLIVMQRLHAKDPSGRALNTGDYYHLCLPMRYDTTVQCPKDWRTEEGELVWPERFPLEAVEVLEKDLGSRATIAAQLQQRPTPKGGLIFHEKDFRYYHPDGMKQLDPMGKPCLALPLDRAGQWFQSWDMTFKDGDGTDMVAGGCWQGVNNELFIHDCLNERLSFTKSCAAVKRMSQDWARTMRKLIENKANGPAVENQLKNEVPGIWLCEPQGGKVARANASTVFFEKGQIIFPHPDWKPWVTTLVEQLTKFPFAAHDDMVDMVTQAILHYYRSRNRMKAAMQAVGKELPL